jgi:hypothetical protein
MKKEKKDQIIRRISEQSMLKLTPMPSAAPVRCGVADKNPALRNNQEVYYFLSILFLCQI